MPKFMNLPFLATGSTNPVPPTPADWKPVIDNVVNAFTVANIVAVIAAVVAAGIVFVFLWWGMRIAFRSIMGAVKNGTLSINAKRGRRRG